VLDLVLKRSSKKQIDYDDDDEDERKASNPHLQGPVLVSFPSIFCRSAWAAFRMGVAT